MKTSLFKEPEISNDDTYLNLYGHLFITLVPIRPSVHPTIHPSIHPSIYLPTYLYLSTYFYIYKNCISMYLSTYLPIYLPVYLFIYLSTSLSVLHWSTGLLVFIGHGCRFTASPDVQFLCWITLSACNYKFTGRNFKFLELHYFNHELTNCSSIKHAVTVVFYDEQGKCSTN